MVRFTVLTASILVSTACATPPPPSSKYSLATCDALRDEVAAAQDDKRAAVDRRDGAWKVVIPFAVLGRYAAGASDAKAADEHLASLNAHASSKGCSL